MDLYALADSIGECVLPVRRFHDLADASERWYALKPAEGAEHAEAGALGCVQLKDRCFLAAVSTISHRNIGALCVYVHKLKHGNCVHFGGNVSLFQS